jgi:NAD(P)-dependent dehydrogenase (short-subunit alcohol dehydrogenase family)
LKLNLKGRRVLVTGGSQGLGLSIAKGLVSEGADVAIVARSKEMLESAELELSRDAINGQKILARPCDISSETDVQSIIGEVTSYFDGLDVLINNASVFGPMGSLTSVSWQEWIETFNVNLFGTVYMCREALQFLVKSDRGKIINISGGGAATPYPSLSAYATSKAAMIRFTEELAEEVKENDIDVNSIAPGPLDTRFVDTALNAGEAALGTVLYKEILKIRQTGGTPFKFTSDLCNYMASRVSDGITGKQVSARYDNWREFSASVDDLVASPWFTMRRVDDTIAGQKSPLVNFDD